MKNLKRPFGLAYSTSPPPPSGRMRHPADQDYFSGFRWSLGIHGAAILFVILKTLVFPSQPKLYIPTLRVDLVGLPDLLKKDMVRLPKPAPELENETKTPKSPPPAKISKTERAEKASPEEMLLKPKKITEEDRAKKLKSSLARLKALDKITQLDAQEKEAEKRKAVAAVLVKGNQISKGASLTGEAREAAEATYFDLVRDKLQENWTLNVLLARQKWSARVQIYIDAQGRLRGYKFVKSSGNASFDEAVKAALTRSQPFPAPPTAIAASVQADGISVGFPL